MSDTEKKSRPFRWWDTQAVAELLSQLNARPDSIVKQYIDDPGHLHVHPYHPTTNALVTDGECPPPINNVHICPIDCP